MKVDITASVVIHKAHPLLRPKLREQAGFPGGSNCKESACNGDLGSIPGSGRSPGEGNGKPLQYSCQESSHGQRSLVGYSPQDHKESDMTEQLSKHSERKKDEEIWSSTQTNPTSNPNGITDLFLYNKLTPH